LPVTDTIFVLDADPELGELLAPAEFEVARRALLARVTPVGAGRWRPEKNWTDVAHPTLGLLVLDGLIIRQISVAERPSTELLGAGDVLRPWDQDADVGLPLRISWEVLQDTRLALLDRRFVEAASRWPGVIDAIAGRAQRRSRWLAFLLAMKQIMRVEGRLLVLLWALAERWGVMTPRGVHLRLKLTHEALGKLVGARRPSVTTALGALADAGLLERLPDGYRLHGNAEDALRRVTGPADEPAAA
jgi:CRP/FNR family transcriptional regulator, cyclic AMP receptor protein